MRDEKYISEPTVYPSDNASTAIYQNHTSRPKGRKKLVWSLTRFSVYFSGKKTTVFALDTFASLPWVQSLSQVNMDIIDPGSFNHENVNRRKLSF